MKKEIVIPENRDFKGVWIPRKLYESRDFTPNEKFLILEIYSLSSKGSCYASNTHFADFIGLKENTVQKMIAKFEANGYLTRDFEYKENNPKEIKRRWLTLTNKFYNSFINECEDDSEVQENNQWGGGNKSESHGKKSMRVVDKNSERSNTSLSENYKSNTDLSTTSHNKDYIKNSIHNSEQEMNNMYAGFPKQENPGTEKKSRFIPVDYTEEQLAEHVESVYWKAIDDYCCHINDKVDEYADTLTKITAYFHRKFQEKYHSRCRILSDKAYIRIAEKFCDPPEVMENIYGFERYAGMIDRYFETNYNERGNYDGDFEPSLAHFMSDTIRENLYRKTSY